MLRLVMLILKWLWLCLGGERTPDLELLVSARLSPDATERYAPRVEAAAPVQSGANNGRCGRITF